MVADVAPGELVRAQQISERRGVVFASVVEVLEGAGERRRPPCPVADRCGGCDWQHLTYTAQLAAKRAIVRENLSRLAAIEVPPDRIDTNHSAEWSYRSRIQLHLTEDGKPAFRARGSSDLVPIDRCPVAEEQLNTALDTVSHGRPAGARVQLLATDTGAVRAGDVDRATISVGGTPFTFHPAAFAQSNRGMLDALAAEIARLDDADALIDLYAGAGLLASLYLGSHAIPRRVICVESDRRNAGWIPTNLTAHGFAGRPIVHATTVEQALRRGLALGGSLVLVDPPRSGLSRSVRSALLASPPATLAYLSCDPGSLARDVGSLAPRFTLDRICVLDFLPQTSHIETWCVMRLRR